MKKNIYRLSLSCILAIVTLSFAKAQEWTKYKSAEMNFSILFPKSPAESEQSTPTALGNMTLHILMADLSQDASASNMLYMVNYTAFPDSVSSDHKDKMDAFFEGSINGMVKNVNGTLASSKNIDYKSFPGREIKVEIQGGVITAREILIHNKLYIVMVISATGKDDNADVKKFFDSFESEG